MQIEMAYEATTNSMTAKMISIMFIAILALYYSINNVHNVYEIFSINYRLQRSCGQGNIFTPVCHSFCSQGGGGSASVHVGIPPTREQTPPGSRHPHWEQTPPRSRPPQEQTPPWEQTPPLGADTPPEQTPPSRHPPPPPGSKLRHTVNERPVSTLLECILVHVINIVVLIYTLSK